MKKKDQKKYVNIWFYSMFFLSAITFLACSTQKWLVPEAYMGEWYAAKQKITIRIKPDGKYIFISDSASIQIGIASDKTVIGKIGTASFSNGKLRKNPTLPWETGVAYIVECGYIGKIFSNDPLENKEIEIWLSPIDSSGLIEAELRYTEGMAVFPMAGIMFRRK